MAQYLNQPEGNCLIKREAASRLDNPQPPLLYTLVTKLLFSPPAALTMPSASI
jgi:hypothetical protein